MNSNGNPCFRCGEADPHKFSPWGTYCRKCTSDYQREYNRTRRKADKRPPAEREAVIRKAKEARAAKLRLLRDPTPDVVCSCQRWPTAVHPECLHTKFRYKSRSGKAKAWRDSIKADLLDRQGGVCASCSTSEPRGKGDGWHLDHCHATGTIRGVLCGDCNTALGFARDSVERLEAMLGRPMGWSDEW